MPGANGATERLFLKTWGVEVAKKKPTRAKRGKKQADIDHAG
jgi:hypothetical protein